MTVRNIFEKLILSLVFVVPLIFDGKGWIFNYGFLRLWVIYCGVFLGWLAWVVVVINEKKMILPQRIFLIGMVLWFLSLTISSIFGLSFKDSLIGRYGLWTTSVLSYFVFFSLSYFVFFVAKGNILFKNRLVVIFISSGLILTGYEIINHWQILSETERGLRMVANFKNPLEFGFYLTILWTMCLGIFLTEKRGGLWILGFFGLLMFSVGIVLSQTRSSWVVVIIAGVTALVILLRRKIPEKNRLKLLVFFLVILASVSSPLVINRINIDMSGNRISHQIRIGEWQTGLKIWQENFWLGVGPENVDLAYPKLRSKDVNLIPEEWKWRTITIRNYYVEIVATQGVLGLIVISYWVWLFWSLIHSLLKNEKTENGNLLLILAIFAYGLHAFLYAPDKTAQLLLFSLLGLIMTVGKFEINLEKKGRVRKLLGASVVLGVSVGLYCMVRLLWSEVAMWRSVELLNKDSLGAVLFAQKAYEKNPLFDKNLRLLLISYQELLRKGGVDDDKRLAMIDVFERYLKLLTGRNTLDIENLKIIAGGYMRLEGWRNVSRKEAVYWGSRLIKIDPTGPGSWDTLGVIYLDNKDYDKALEVYEYIIQYLKPDYAYAYFHTGEIYRQKGESEKSIPYYEEALKLGFGGAEKEIEETRREIEIL